MITYAYDANGDLITRASSSSANAVNYVLGDQFETNAAGTITTSYTNGPAGNLASYNGPPISTSTVTYLYYDAHGNLAAEANTSGTQTANHTYDPFGAPLDSVPSNTTTHRFVGRWNKQYDTTTGDILMGARPYDPTTGRFLSVDPIPGGSLNNYDYAGQDPINNYDLNGLCSWWDLICLAKAAIHHVWHFSMRVGRAIAHVAVTFGRGVGRNWRNAVEAGIGIAVTAVGAAMIVGGVAIAVSCTVASGGADALECGLAGFKFSALGYMVTVTGGYIVYDVYKKGRVVKRQRVWLHRY
jgi:RHS repeat-associated protein